MTLYKPGLGKGPAMHQRRVRALEALEDAGLLSYDRYDRPSGAYVVEVAAEKYTLSAPEATAFVVGMASLYSVVRQQVDEIVGDAALEAMDDRYLEALDAAASGVLPPGDEL